MYYANILMYIILFLYLFITFYQTDIYFNT